MRWSVVWSGVAPSRYYKHNILRTLRARWNLDYVDNLFNIVELTVRYMYVCITNLTGCSVGVFMADGFWWMFDLRWRSKQKKTFVFLLWCKKIVHLILKLHLCEFLIMRCDQIIWWLNWTFYYFIQKTSFCFLTEIALQTLHWHWTLSNLLLGVIKGAQKR